MGVSKLVRHLCLFLVDRPQSFTNLTLTLHVGGHDFKSWVGTKSPCDYFKQPLLGLSPSGAYPFLFQHHGSVKNGSVISPIGLLPFQISSHFPMFSMIMGEKESWEGLKMSFGWRVSFMADWNPTGIQSWELVYWKLNVWVGSILNDTNDHINRNQSDKNHGLKTADFLIIQHMFASNLKNDRSHYIVPTQTMHYCKDISRRP